MASSHADRGWATRRVVHAREDIHYKVYIPLRFTTRKRIRRRQAVDAKGKNRCCRTRICAPPYSILRTAELESAYTRTCFSEGPEPVSAGITAAVPRLIHSGQHRPAYPFLRRVPQGGELEPDQGRFAHFSFILARWRTRFCGPCQRFGWTRPANLFLRRTLFCVTARTWAGQHRRTYFCGHGGGDPIAWRTQICATSTRERIPTELALSVNRTYTRKRVFTPASATQTLRGR